MRKIQRAWKKKLLTRRRRQRLAATKIQAFVRGAQARRQVGVPPPASSSPLPTLGRTLWRFPAPHCPYNWQIAVRNTSCTCEQDSCSVRLGQDLLLMGSTMYLAVPNMAGCYFSCRNSLDARHGLCPTSKGMVCFVAEGGCCCWSTGGRHEGNPRDGSTPRGAVVAARALCPLHGNLEAWRQQEALCWLRRHDGGKKPSPMSPHYTLKNRQSSAGGSLRAKPLSCLPVLLSETMPQSGTTPLLVPPIREDPC